MKGYLVDMDNWFNKVFPLFDPLNSEFSPDDRIIDYFSNHFSFHLFSKSKDQHFKSCIQQLNNLAIKLSNTPLIALIITDASIKKQCRFLYHTYTCSQ